MVKLALLLLFLGGSSAAGCATPSQSAVWSPRVRGYVLDEDPNHPVWHPVTREKIRCESEMEHWAVAFHEADAQRAQRRNLDNFMTVALAPLALWGFLANETDVESHHRRMRWRSPFGGSFHEQLDMARAAIAKGESSRARELVRALLRLHARESRESDAYFILAQAEERIGNSRAAVVAYSAYVRYVLDRDESRFATAEAALMGLGAPLEACAQGDVPLVRPSE